MKLCSASVIWPKLCLLLLLGVGTGHRAFGQSLIVGIPSIQTAEKGHLELTHESQINTWSAGKLKWNSFNFLCYGITEHIEVTAALMNTNNQGLRNEIVGVGFKAVQPLAKDNGFAKWQPKLALGANSFMQVYGSGKVGYWVYGLSSVRLPNKLRTRFTAGYGYATGELLGFKRVRNPVLSPSPGQGTMPGDSYSKKSNAQAHVLLGIEQPITEHFSVIADWYSGKHDLAAVIPAVQYEFPRIVLIGGYKLSNYDRNEDAVIFEMLYRF